MKNLATYPKTVRGKTQEKEQNERGKRRNGHEKHKFSPAARYKAASKFTYMIEMVFGVIGCLLSTAHITGVFRM